MNARSDRVAVDRRKYCQLSSTDDGRQFTIPSVHSCRTKLIKHCDDRCVPWRYFLSPEFETVSEGRALILEIHEFLYSTVIEGSLNTYSQLDPSSHFK